MGRGKEQEEKRKGEIAMKMEKSVGKEKVERKKCFYEGLGKSKKKRRTMKRKKKIKCKNKVNKKTTQF